MAMKRNYFVSDYWQIKGKHIILSFRYLWGKKWWKRRRKKGWTSAPNGKWTQMASLRLSWSTTAPRWPLTADGLTWPIPLKLWMRPRTRTVYKRLFFNYLQPSQSISCLKLLNKSIRSRAHTEGVRWVQIKTRLSNITIPASSLTKVQNLFYLITESPDLVYLSSQLPWPKMTVIAS